MSRSYWLLYIAIGGLVLAAIIGGSFYLAVRGFQTEPQEKQYAQLHDCGASKSAQSQNAPRNGSVTNHKRTQTKKSPPKPDAGNRGQNIQDNAANAQCERAQQAYYSSEDLDAQRRMADATIQSVHWSRVTFAGMFLIGLLDVLLVAAALGVAFWAAIEARHAVNEAKRGADIAEKSFKNFERPYVYATEIRLFVKDGHVARASAGRRFYNFTSSTGGPCVGVKAKNYGRTPARLLGASLIFRVHELGDPRTPAVYKSEKHYRLIEMLGTQDSSEEFIIGPLPEAVKFLSEIDKGKRILTLSTKIISEDVFKNESGTSNLYYWSPEQERFLYGTPFGGGTEFSGKQANRAAEKHGGQSSGAPTEIPS